MKNITIRRFIFYLSLLKFTITVASDGPPFTFAHFFCVPFELAYSPASPSISDLPSCSFSSLLKLQTFFSATIVDHQKYVVEVAMMPLHQLETLPLEYFPSRLFRNSSAHRSSILVEPFHQRSQPEQRQRPSLYLTCVSLLKSCFTRLF